MKWRLLIMEMTKLDHRSPRAWFERDHFTKISYSLVSFNDATDVIPFLLAAASFLLNDKNISAQSHMAFSS